QQVGAHAGVAARVVADMVAVDGRLGAALAVASGAAAGVGAYLLSAWALRAPELRLRRVPAVEPVS
ncbi:MAG TPA: hypothetical protein VNT52_16835, partial [Acidimicrobiales bacterium]|nr:hypothetical protein [Acidimicrobiales bacterium]